MPVVPPSKLHLRRQFPPSNGNGNGFGFNNQPCPFCVNDSDPRIRYEGQWKLVGQPPQTTHETTLAGSTITFRFKGSGVVVLGTTPQSNSSFLPPTATFSLDADEPQSSTQPFADVPFAKQAFFSRSQLSNQEHTLVINITSAPAAPFILDNFVVFPPFNGTNRSVTNPTSASWSPVMTANATLSTPTSSVPSNNQVDGSMTAVKVLAGFLGAMVLILLGVVGFLAWSLRTKHKALTTQLSEIKNSNSKAGNKMEQPPCLMSYLTTTESVFRNNPDMLYSDGQGSDWASQRRLTVRTEP